MNVTFLKVHDNKTKIQRLLEVIHHHFYKGDRILIMVSNATAANYINELLWSTPPESFIPHIMTDASSMEQLVITQKKNNVNRSSVVVNLSSEIWEESIEHLYELMDTTSKEKETLSRQKVQHYGVDLVRVL